MTSNRVWEIGPVVARDSPTESSSVDPDEAAVALHEVLGQHFGRDRITSGRDGQMREVFVRFSDRETAKSAISEVESLSDRYIAEFVRVVAVVG